MERDDLTVQSDVLLTERIGNVLVLTLNRPEVRNALNPGLKDRLTQEMREADADPGVRAVVITGNGPVFCAGMDLKAFAQGADFGGLMRERRWGTDEETAAVFRSGDAMEGARAFAERRTPVWTGK